MVTLGTGTDSVSFASGTNAVNAVIGAGATLQAGDSLAGGSGIDTLNLSGSGSIDLNSIGLTGFETLNLGANETVTLNNASLVVHGEGNDVVTLGTGTDSVSFASGSNTVNAVIGAGATLQAGDSLAGGSGIDTLNLTGSGSFNFSSITHYGIRAGQPSGKPEYHACQHQPLHPRQRQRCRYAWNWHRPCELCRRLKYCERGDRYRCHASSGG